MRSIGDDPLEGKELLVFFPEGLIAIVAVIGAPIWAFILARQHHVVAGICFWLGAWSLGYLAYWSYRKGSRGGIFIALLGNVGLLLAIHKWVH
jgi:hypothetical protein